MFARTHKVQRGTADQVLQRTPVHREVATVTTTSPASSGSRPDFSRTPIHARGSDEERGVGLAIGRIVSRLSPDRATDEQADEILGILMAFRSAYPEASRFFVIQQGDAFEGWLRPFGFVGTPFKEVAGERYAVDEYRLQENFDASIARWFHASSRTRRALRIRARYTLGPVASGALEARASEVHSEQLEDGSYFEGTNDNLKQARAFARGNVVQQQIEGMVNAGPASLVGRALGTVIDGERGGEIGAAIGALGDAILPFVAVLTGTGGRTGDHPPLPPASQSQAQSEPYVPEKDGTGNRPDPSTSATAAVRSSAVEPSSPARSRPMRALAGGEPRTGMRATGKTLTSLKPSRPEVTHLPRPSAPLPAQYSSDAATNASAPKRSRQNTGPFLNAQLAIVSDPSHPLHNLTVETPGPDGKITYTWRTTTFTAESGRVITGRYPGNEEGPVMQVGHADSFASGAREFLMLEDAEFNQVSGQRIESSAKGASSHKIPVEVRGAIIDMASLEQLERLGVVVVGTASAARRLK